MTQDAGRERAHKVLVRCDFEGFTIEAVGSPGMSDTVVTITPHTTQGYPEDVSVTLATFVSVATIIEKTFAEIGR